MAPPRGNHLIRNRAVAGADRASVFSSALIGGLHRAANSTDCGEAKDLRPDPEPGQG